MVLARLTRRVGLLGSAVALSACFAADDFALCRRSDECGPGAVCTQGECVDLDAPDAVSPPTTPGTTPPTDPGTTPPTDPDECVERVIEGRLSASETVRCEEGIVRIRDVVVESESGRTFADLTVIAREVFVEGTITADGAGERGGGGGGGGAGGSGPRTINGGLGGRLNPGDSARTERDGEPGTRNQSIDGGTGGLGGRGGGAGGGVGGPGGTSNPVTASGNQGADATFADPSSSVAGLCQALRRGSGGGGGGGGAGLDGDAASAGQVCSVGAGGGGGGAGAPGGGLVVLQASERLVITGKIFARGRAPDAGDPSVGRALPPQPEPGCAQCDANCGEAAGAGANGGDVGNRGQRGGDGAQTAGKPSGAGGSGGAGSGGMVYLRSPNLEWGPDGSIDVSGGSNNGGLVRREVDAEGPALEPGAPLRVKGESTVCAPVPFTTTDEP